MKDDIIRRQAAIEALQNHYEVRNPKQNAIMDECVMLILNVPSAQPTGESCWCCNCPKMERLKEQKTFSEMVHLHDAETHDKHTETHSCDSERTETHDLVSRQSAIDSVCEVCENCEYFYNEKLIQTIKDLPSVQPEIIRCKDCVLNQVCRFGQYLGLDGYCSRGERQDG